VIYDVTGELRGSISAEHGIGVKKREYLPQSRRETDIDAMRAIKTALDPLNLLNPGKVV
jgi:FAD/FMN-containing dehydrogenase